MEANLLKKKAICLARVSTLQQELESQTTQIVAAAKADGYDDENIILVQNKESAVKRSEAELLGINEMKYYIEQGDVSAVYCFEISRLSRRPRDLYAIRDYLLDHGVQLVVLTPYFRLLDANGMLDATASVVFALFGSFAEQENLLRAERCKRGKRKKIESGRFGGGKLLFAYDRDKNDNFIVDPEKAEVVRRIFNMFVGGMNRLEISREIRAEGYMQNFMSDVAAHSHVDNILRNADYTGLHGKPQIISESLFAQAQELLNKPKVKRRKVNCTALCRGIMFNPESASHRKQFYVRGNEGSYYCLLDKTEERKKFVRMADIDAVVWDAVKKEYDKIKENSEERRLQKQRAAIIDKKIKKLNSDIIGSAKKIEAVEERYIMGRISEEKANELELKINMTVSSMEKEVENLRREQEELYRNDLCVKDPDKLNGDQREELVARLVHHIDLVPLSEAKCMSKWRYSIYFKRGDVHFGYLVSGRQAREDIKNEQIRV